MKFLCSLFRFLRNIEFKIDAWNHFSLRGIVLLEIRNHKNFNISKMDTSSVSIRLKSGYKFNHIILADNKVYNSLHSSGRGLKYWVACRSSSFCCKMSGAHGIQQVAQCCNISAKAIPSLFRDFKSSKYFTYKRIC